MLEAANHFEYYAWKNVNMNSMGRFDSQISKLAFAYSTSYEQLQASCFFKNTNEKLQASRFSKAQATISMPSNCNPVFSAS